MLHFYNNNLKLESILIGFEYLNKELYYTGSILYDYLNKVLREYIIYRRLLAITRDNASPITKLVREVQTNYKEKYSINVIDIRYFAHILNIISNTFLTNIFFIPNRTKKFKTSITTLNRTNPEFKDLYEIIKALPNTIRSIINAIKYNYFLKNKFKQIVRKIKDLAPDVHGPEILIKDNSTR